MFKSHLEQGQRLSAVGTPDFNADGTCTHVVGQFGCLAIFVTQLAGPMGWYDCARVVLEDGAESVKEILIPLHQCDYIAL